jgi:hypothetical protein
MSRTRLHVASSEPKLFRFIPLENLLSNLSSVKLFALTAPLVMDNEVMVGYALNLETQDRTA